MRKLVVIRDEPHADADRAEAAIEKLGPMLTSDILERLAEAAKERLRGVAAPIAANMCAPSLSAWR